MPSPPSFALLIGQVDAESVLFLSAVFHRFSRKCFIVYFLSYQSKQCAFHTVIHMALVWLGSVDVSLPFFLWLLIIQILLWHIVQEGCSIALEVRLKSDPEAKFHFSLKVFLAWSKRCCGVGWQCSAVTRMTLAVEGEPTYDGPTAPWGAHLHKLRYKLHSGLLRTLSQCKQQHGFPSHIMNQTELIRPVSQSTPILCTPPTPK